VESLTFGLQQKNGQSELNYLVMRLNQFEALMQHRNARCQAEVNAQSLQFNHYRRQQTKEILLFMNIAASQFYTFLMTTMKLSIMDKNIMMI
jgi:hypothetical protein